MAIKKRSTAWGNHPYLRFDFKAFFESQKQYQTYQINESGKGKFI